MALPLLLLPPALLPLPPASSALASSTTTALLHDDLKDPGVEGSSRSASKDRGNEAGRRVSGSDAAEKGE